MADALKAHAQAREFGGRPGLRDAGLLESALGRPYVGYYHSIAAKGAALVESLIGNHAFIDANKRVGTLLLIQLIERSNWTLPASDDELGDMILAVARGDWRYDDLVPWLAARIRRP